MIIILRRIPENTKQSDIIDFLKTALKGRIYQKTGQVELIQNMILKDIHTNTRDLHCLVTIDSNEAAERVIRKLNRKMLNGKHIAVREYINRSWHNDPRDNAQKGGSEIAEYRKTDRRQAKLEAVAKTSGKFSSSDQFHRTY